MHRARAGLMLYGAAMVALTFVHELSGLLVALLLVLLAAGRDAPRLLGRALRMVFLFTLAVSLAYALAAWLRGESPWPTLLRFNLRVVTLAVLTFIFMARVNLFRALDFSPGLTYLLGLAYSQALTFRRVHEDFRLALISRSIHRPALRYRYRASAAAASWLLGKGLHAARDIAEALRARGFFLRE